MMYMKTWNAMELTKLKSREPLGDKHLDNNDAEVDLLDRNYEIVCDEAPVAIDESRPFSVGSNLS
jgi:hypothetical protein